MKGKIIIMSAAAILLGLSQRAEAKDMAVKIYGDIGLTKAPSLTVGLPGVETKGSSHAFGVDFGYTFWKQGHQSLEANIGIGYRLASSTFSIDELSYEYSAPASADEDGNPYRRFTTLSDLSQQVTLGYLSIPVYLQYQYRINSWLGVHADLGFGLGFRCQGSIGKARGTATCWGVYPEYDDLVIKADYLNDFGERKLSSAGVGQAQLKGFNASVMAGIGFEFYVAEPVSFDLGLRYNAGLTDVFTGRYNLTAAEASSATGSPAAGSSQVYTFNAETAPLTYTVADGSQLKPLTDYVTKSRLSPLSLRLAVIIRF